MSRTREQWIALAQQRIGNILSAYSCCPIRMLEAKISEAGPGDKRPNPLSISEGLKRLQSLGHIHVIPKQGPTDTPFYAPKNLDITSSDFSSILTKRRHLYLVHKGLTERNEFCSDVLEGIIDSALSQTAAVFHSRFRDQKLPAKRPLDFVVELGHTLCGGEIKNYREWLYPESPEIWTTISKCCELNALPVLVTRKLPYITYLLFGRIGMIGYQTHFQFFHPVVEPEIARVKSIDGLGYKDIRLSLAPDTQMLSFFHTTLPRIAPAAMQNFLKNKDTLKYFADDQRLGDPKLHPRSRALIFAEAWKHFFGTQAPEDLFI